MRLIGIFGASILLFVALSFVIGIATGFMPGIFPIIILSAILTGIVNNRLESRRRKEELDKDTASDPNRIP